MKLTKSVTSGMGYCLTPAQPVMLPAKYPSAVQPIRRATYSHSLATPPSVQGWRTRRSVCYAVENASEATPVESPAEEPTFEELGVDTLFLVSSWACMAAWSNMPGMLLGAHATDNMPTDAVGCI